MIIIFMSEIGDDKEIYNEERQKCEVCNKL